MAIGCYVLRNYGHLKELNANIFLEKIGLNFSNISWLFVRYIFLEKIGLIFSNISWLFVRYIFLEKIGLIFSNISWLFVRYICK